MNESDEHSLYKADSLSDSDSDDYQFESSGVLDHILNKYRHLQVVHRCPRYRCWRESNATISRVSLIERTT